MQPKQRAGGGSRHAATTDYGGEGDRAGCSEISGRNRQVCIVRIGHSDTATGWPDCRAPFPGWREPEKRPASLRYLPAVQKQIAGAMLKAAVRLPSDGEDAARVGHVEFLDNAVQNGSG